MDSLIVCGGNRLNGEIRLRSAKNAVLPIIACSIMSKQEVILRDCPRISDIENMLLIINSIGGSAFYRGNDIVINCKDASPANVEQNLTSSIRSSVFILGPIIARFKRARIAYPGGCEIGKRPIDLHITGLRSLGVEISEELGVIDCCAKDIHAGEVTLDFPSVGATENIMMAACLTKGTTIINNAAREPEIVDLQFFINHLGGRISGAGSERIVIEGVSELGGGVYTPICDRIVAGTILAGVAACGGRVTIRNAIPSMLCSVLDCIEECGCVIERGEDYITIESSSHLKMIKRIVTEPYPGFPTDMQAQLMAMLATAEGEGVIEENLFENRFRHAQELRKMGACITIEGRRAVIKGVESLSSCEVEARDLRGGAALLIAALNAAGESRINNISHVDRGYEKIEETFNALGAKITRIRGD